MCVCLYANSWSKILSPLVGQTTYCVKVCNRAMAEWRRSHAAVELAAGGTQTTTKITGANNTANSAQSSVQTTNLFFDCYSYTTDCSQKHQACPLLSTYIRSAISPNSVEAFHRCIVIGNFLVHPWFCEAHQATFPIFLLTPGSSIVFGSDWTLPITTRDSLSSLDSLGLTAGATIPFFNESNSCATTRRIKTVKLRSFREN